MLDDGLFMSYLKERGVTKAPRPRSFFWKAWRAQIIIEDRVKGFFIWFGLKFFLMLLSFAVWVWSFGTIFLFALNVFAVPREFSNGLDYLVNSPAVKLYENPILWFGLSGGLFMYLLYRYYRFRLGKQP